MAEQDEQHTSTMPPRPQLSRRSSGDIPVRTGSLATLGVKAKSPDDAFYFVAARGALRRYGRRFPFTDEGWRTAWETFSREDPTAAQDYLATLDGALPAPGGAQGPSTPAATRSLSEGWLYILLGGAGWVLAGVLAYAGAANASGGLVLVGGLIGFASVAVTAIGVVAEGILLARRQG